MVIHIPRRGSKVCIDKFMIYLDRKGLCERSKKKYRIVFNKLKEISLSDLNKKSCEKAFFILKQASDLNDESKSSYWFRFRIFVKWLKPKIDISEYRFSVKKKRKLPEEILSVEEVRKIIYSAKTVRDRAMLSCLYDSGCRPSELLGLKKGDIIYDQDGLVITFDGKTGQRRIRIITTLESDKLLKEYLDICQTDFLFPFSVERLEHILKEYSNHANITKRIYPYIFRHSRATHLAKHLTEQQMKVYLGWAMDSKMVGVYVHLSGRDLDEKVYELNHRQLPFISNSPSFQSFLQEMYERWKSQTLNVEKSKVMA